MNARGDVILQANVREGEEPRAYALALTLGAMAEIEMAFEVDNVEKAFARLATEETVTKTVDGVETTETVRRNPSMNDMVKLLAALIRAGGRPEMDEAAVRQERFELSAVTAALEALFAGIGGDKAAGKSTARPPRQTGRAGSQ